MMTNPPGRIATTSTEIALKRSHDELLEANRRLDLLAHIANSFIQANSFRETGKSAID